jgi:hypothetical protein
MASKEAKQLRREAASSEAELQSLYSYAEQHQLNLLPYTAAFTKIEGHLRLIDDHLRQREARTEEARSSHHIPS